MMEVEIVAMARARRLGCEEFVRSCEGEYTRGMALSSAEPPPHPPAHRARGIAGDPERQREIIFAHDLPAVARRHGGGRRAGNVPAVVLAAADQSVAGTREKPVLGKIADVVLEQDQPRLPAREIEAAEHFQLVALDVD